MLRQDYIQEGSRTYLETRDLIANIKDFLSSAYSHVDSKTISFINSFIASMVETIEDGETDSTTLVISDKALKKFITSEKTTWEQQLKEFEKVSKYSKPIDQEKVYFGLNNSSAILSDPIEAEEVEVIENQQESETLVSATNKKKKKSEEAEAD